ncbi:MAG: hypothetical protein HY960_13150 [Ignavibacteriae bacterium]|nr:hypothetical protein [Ignavibacteriota bacterium]
MTQWRLKDADTTLRLFLTAFLLVLTIGYSIGLFFVEHKSSGSPSGLVEEYRGTPEGIESAELKYEKSADEMYIFLHNHILSLSFVFFALGGLFYFSSIKESWKTLLMVEPLIAIITTFGGIWAMRFVSEHFVWLVLISGTSMVGCYFVMVGLMLKELWFRKTN